MKDNLKEEQRLRKELTAALRVVVNKRRALRKLRETKWRLAAKLRKTAAKPKLPAAEKKLQASIKSLQAIYGDGTKEGFIRWLAKDEKYKPQVAGICEDRWQYEAYRREAVYLGLRKGKQVVVECSAPAKFNHEGAHLCGIHYRSLLRSHFDHQS